MANIKLGMTLNQVENAICNNRNEHGALFKNGKIVRILKGTRHNLIVDTEMDEFIGSTSNLILTHNHPRNPPALSNGLSAPDIWSGLSALKEIRAVTSDRYVYSLKCPKNRLSYMQLKHIIDDLGRVYHKLRYEHNEQISKIEVADTPYIQYNELLTEYGLEVRKFKLRRLKNAG